MLMRRREMWWPTAAGWLALATSAALLVVVFAGTIVGFLAVSEPATGPDGEGARTLVVEGWLSEAELARAVLTFRQHNYERVFTTGGPTEAWSDGPRWRNFADRAADYLHSHGLAERSVIALPAPASAQERTFLSAVMVRDFAAREARPLIAVDVFTSHLHARRSRALFRLALGPDVEVGILPAGPDGGADGRWWSSSAGLKGVLGEAVSVAWTACCFWPAPAGSHAERWAPP